MEVNVNMFMARVVFSYLLVPADVISPNLPKTLACAGRIEDLTCRTSSGDAKDLSISEIVVRPSSCSNC